MGDSNKYAPTNGLNYHEVILLLNYLGHSTTLDLQEIALAYEALAGSDWAKEWPMSEVYQAIRSAMVDGLTQEEAIVLQEKIAKVFRGEARTVGIHLDNGTPINFKGRTFCFTGQMRIGTRKQCSEITVSLGGKVLDRLRGDVDYLVMGSIASRQWAFPNYGRKIEAAMMARAAGEKKPILVAEDDFVSAIEIEKRKAG